MEENKSAPLTLSGILYYTYLLPTYHVFPTKLVSSTVVVLDSVGYTLIGVTIHFNVLSSCSGISGLLIVTGCLSLYGLF